MTSEEFKHWLFTHLTLEELSKINERIYYNPDHVAYYQHYHAGDYMWCMDFLNRNRKLLQ